MFQNLFRFLLGVNFLKIAISRPASPPASPGSSVDMGGGRRRLQAIHNDNLDCITNVNIELESDGYCSPVKNDFYSYEVPNSNIFNNSQGSIWCYIDPCFIQLYGNNSVVFSNFFERPNYTTLIAINEDYASKWRNVTTQNLTSTPTRRPTNPPTRSPSQIPTSTPTKNPSKNPTKMPTLLPTKLPTSLPAQSPTPSPPIGSPSNPPTLSPPIGPPTISPTLINTNPPTLSPPIGPPTRAPSRLPTSVPSSVPTNIPTSIPTFPIFTRLLLWISSKTHSDSDSSEDNEHTSQVFNHTCYNYTYTDTSNSTTFCIRTPKIVQVLNDKVKSVTFASRSSELYCRGIYHINITNYFTIDQWFTKLSGLLDAWPSVANITYNNTLNYPSNVHLDFQITGNNTINDTFFTITDLVPITNK